MIELNPAQFDQAACLFSDFDEHLAVASILAGLTPGRVWQADSPTPEWALAAFQSRLYLAGELNSPGAAVEAHQLLVNVIVPMARQNGLEGLVLQSGSGDWPEAVSTILAGLNNFSAPRQCYMAHSLTCDWRPLLPEGFELQPVTADLVGRSDLESVAELRAELCSERPSLADFFDKSFGVCLLHGNELAAWCLSEYNLDGRCEVGVATMEAYRRRGLGTVVSLALVEESLRRGYHTIGWHCWQRNLASAALARRAGFRLHSASQAMIILLNEDNQQ